MTISRYRNRQVNGMQWSGFSCLIPSFIIRQGWTWTDFPDPLVQHFTSHWHSFLAWVIWIAHCPGAFLSFIWKSHPSQTRGSNPKHSFQQSSVLPVRYRTFSARFDQQDMGVAKMWGGVVGIWVGGRLFFEQRGRSDFPGFSELLPVENSRERMCARFVCQLILEKYRFLSEIFIWWI